LLVMSAVAIGSIRNQEAKGYLDNILIQPVHRSAWLTKRLLTIVGMVAVISLITSYAVWQIASSQGIALDLGIILQNAISLIGTVVLLIGVGALIYGILPRFAAIIMYAAIIWAFIVDILKVIFSLNDSIEKTSLLHYVSFTQTKTPDWSTFAWLVSIGIVTGALGIVAFSKRDIIPE
jgi:putative exporter of polyketide antibiotics